MAFSHEKTPGLQIEDRDESVAFSGRMVSACVDPRQIWYGNHPSLALTLTLLSPFAGSTCTGSPRLSWRSRPVTREI